MDRPPPSRDGSPPSKRTRLQALGDGDDAGAAAPAPELVGQPALPAGDPQDWRAAMTATLAALSAQVEAGLAAAAAQAEVSRATASAQAETSRAAIEALRELVTQQGATIRLNAESAATNHTRTTARLDLLRATVDAGQFALGVAHGERLRLAMRARLSDAEELLAIPYLSQRSVMSYLHQDEALELRTASRTCREAVAEHGWSDWYNDRSVIKRNVAGWRKCFPLARAAMLFGNKALTDADFVPAGCAQRKHQGLQPSHHHRRGVCTPAGHPHA